MPKNLITTIITTFTVLLLLTACMETSSDTTSEPSNQQFEILSTAFTVDEITESPSLVGNILVNSANQIADYSILDGNVDDTFTLNATTGELLLNKAINHNVTPEFTLNIQVRDANGLIDTKAIKLTINRYDTLHNWQLLSSWISSYEIYTVINETLNETLVNELHSRSGGQLNITIHPVDLVDGVRYLDVYDQIKEGLYELGHTASYWYTDKNPANAFFTSQPFGLSEEQHKAWLKAEGQSLWDELNAQDNLIAFRAGTSGEKSIGWFNQPISSPSDLNGLKWRIAGFGSEVASRAGANVIPSAALPNFREYATVLKDGTVDALRWSDPYSDWQLDLHSSDAIYYRGPDWSEQSAALAMYVSLDTYNSLPIRLQNAIKEASEATAVAMSDAYKVENARAIADMQAYGVDIRDFPQAVLDVLETHADAIQAERVSNSEDYRRVYESWKKFRD